MSLLRVSDKIVLPAKAEKSKQMRRRFRDAPVFLPIYYRVIY